MKFGVREICNVTFKSLDAQKIGNTLFKKYQPVFTIDTATTSEMSQESTTVYAQGGRGYNRLIAWEGEKTMTFTVTDALMSPMGLKVLTGAGIVSAEQETVHVHATVDEVVGENGVTKVDWLKLADELGIDEGSIYVCVDDAIKVYGTVLDNSGYGYDWIDTVAVSGAAAAENDLIEVAEGGELTFTVDGTYEGATVRFDFYVAMNAGATQINIEPSSFGGYFYVEADTLFRREDNGKDMAATLTFPRVKIQSAFTFTMAATGDPSTFDFVMDAMPGYTQFDHSKKVNVTIALVGSDKHDGEGNEGHKANGDHAKKN